MKGMPDNVATKQDLINLCHDLGVGEARQVLHKHRGMVSDREFREISMLLASRKRKETLKKKKAQARWARYHQLCEQIPAIEADIEEKMRELRTLNRQLANAIKEKGSLTNA